ncbi:MAG: hypothetical protein ACOYYJ_11625 [Chloroflexota bacterium]
MYFKIVDLRVDYEKLSSDRLGGTSASIRERVRAAMSHELLCDFIFF